MNKNFRPWKLLQIWLAVSAVVIIAGVILMALLGFNTASDDPETLQLEVRYNITIIKSEEPQEQLETLCEDVFGKNNISACEMQKTQGLGDGQDWDAFVFKFSPDVSAETQAKVKEDIDAGVKELFKEPLTEVYTVWHHEALQSGAGAVWRGAIAVGLVVALVYVGFRFGVGSALTGLALSVHDALFTLSIFAITRIPVYAAAPVLYAGIAAALFVVFWLIHCMKLRDIKKESQGSVGAEEAVEESFRSSWKKILLFAGIVAVALLLCGVIATAGVRAFFLPMLLCVAVALYSSLLLGPALHIPVKRCFDKFSRKGKAKYVGKQKQTEEE